MRRCLYIVMITAVIISLLSGCKNKEDIVLDGIVDEVFYSTILKKEMQLKIYTPPGYRNDTAYPVLYFFHDYGGSVYTVMEEYGIAVKAEELISNNEIAPLIIVAVDIDRSFGINSSSIVEIVETESGMIFNTGMYMDFFIKEIVPHIDSSYSTIAKKDGRYIGGYSMGGFAALHIALKNPDLFSKVGGHSPSLVIERFKDITVTNFLYPDIETRKERDPIYLVQDGDYNGLQLFLDVEYGGSDGVEFLYNLAIDNGIKAEFRNLSMTHGRDSCRMNMNEYLLFYAGY